MREKTQGFTLIELAIAVFILLLVMMLAVPSISGVLADHRLRRSFDQMNSLVRTAQERSVNDRRTYLIAWEKDQIILRPEAFAEGEDKSPLAVLKVQKGDAFRLELPAALTEKPAPEWIFWPSGTCEPATVSFKGEDGNWTANYPALTARGELAKYAVR